MLQAIRLAFSASDAYCSEDSRTCARFARRTGCRAARERGLQFVAFRLAKFYSIAYINQSLQGCGHPDESDCFLRPRPPAARSRRPTCRYFCFTPPTANLMVINLHRDRLIERIL